MQIHVARNSAQLGIFAPEDIIAGLSSGRFLASDLAWRDGMPAWMGHLHPLELARLLLLCELGRTHDA